MIVHLTQSVEIRTEHSMYNKLHCYNLLDVIHTGLRYVCIRISFKHVLLQARVFDH